MNLFAIGDHVWWIHPPNSTRHGQVVDLTDIHGYIGIQPNDDPNPICPNHDWKTHTTEYEPTYEELSNINTIPTIQYPTDWTQEQRTRCYWRALRSGIHIRSETTWQGILKSIDLERTRP